MASLIQSSNLIKHWVRTNFLEIHQEKYLFLSFTSLTHDLEIEFLRQCCEPVFVESKGALCLLDVVFKLFILQNETLCGIWYHFHHLKNVENTHGGVLLLVLKVTLRLGCFSRFLNCTNGTKLRNALQMAKAVSILGVSMMNALYPFIISILL